MVLPGHFEVESEQRTIVVYSAVMGPGFVQAEVAEVFESCERKMLPGGLAVLLKELEVVGTDMEVPSEAVESLAAFDRGIGILGVEVEDTGARLERC